MVMSCESPHKHHLKPTLSWDIQFYELIHFVFAQANLG